MKQRTYVPLEAYLNRPVELVTLTYPQFFQWWQGATSAQQKKRLKELQKIKNFVTAKQVSMGGFRNLRRGVLLNECAW